VMRCVVACLHCWPSQIVQLILIVMCLLTQNFEISKMSLFYQIAAVSDSNVVNWVNSA